MAQKEKLAFPVPFGTSTVAQGYVRPNGQWGWVLFAASFCVGTPRGFGWL